MPIVRPSRACTSPGRSRGWGRPASAPFPSTLRRCLRKCCCFCRRRCCYCCCYPCLREGAAVNHDTGGASDHHFRNVFPHNTQRLPQGSILSAPRAWRSLRARAPAHEGFSHRRDASLWRTPAASSSIHQQRRRTAQRSGAHVHRHCATGSHRTCLVLPWLSRGSDRYQTLPAAPQAPKNATSAPKRYRGEW